MNFLIVAVGAGLGGGFRYLLSGIIQRLLPVFFPYGTLVVNVIGSIILGFLIFGFDEKSLLHPSVRLFIGVGFCGGLTTFSTFSYETFYLIRDTEFLLAGLNILANVCLTLAGIYIGYLISR